jgi:hypothetical protein
VEHSRITCVRGFLALTCAFVAASCGGGGSGDWDGNGGEPAPYGSDDNAARVVGIAGVAWDAESENVDGIH